jgi:hypothetical protein
MSAIEFSGSGPNGSVIQWPPRSGFVFLHYGSADPDPSKISRSLLFLSKNQINFRKKLNNLILYCQYQRYFFNGHKNVQVGFGSVPVIHWPTGFGKKNSGFLIHGSDPHEIFTFYRIRSTSAVKPTAAFSHKKVQASSTTVPCAHLLH